MSACWVAIPSARPVTEVTAWVERWSAQGYKIALWRDTDRVDAADLCVVAPYPGYSQAANALIKLVLDSDAECSWCVCCGDDTWPDPNKRADEIAEECGNHFWNDHHHNRGGTKYSKGVTVEGDSAATFGVMQPTGDRWGDDAFSRARWPDAPAMIDRICGSPWIGREFATRINGGAGPWWPEYQHNWADEEMQNVAQSLGVLWQRRDLTHYHDHARRNGGQWQAHQKHFDADYTRMKPLFEKRKAAGFPGSDPK